LFVAITHLGTSGYLPALPSLEPTTVMVEFFFLLSGFVMARVYGDSLTDGHAAGVFVLRRIGRLWPLHIALMAVLVVGELVKYVFVDAGDLVPRYPPFTGARDAAYILPNFLMLQAFFDGNGLKWNFPSWSISAEFWTYLVFAGLLLASAGNVVRRLSLSALLSLAAVAAIALWAPQGMQSTDMFGVARCVFSFFAGVIVEQWHRRGAPQWLSGTWAECLAVKAVCLLFGAAVFPIARYASLVVFAPMIVIFAEEAGAVSRLLLRPVAQWIGKVSYSIYLTHAFPVMYVVPRLDGWLGTWLPAESWTHQLLIAVAYVAMVLALSAITYSAIEKPGMRLFAEIGKSGRARQAMARAT